jgi:hypothetical protein
MGDKIEFSGRTPAGEKRRDWLAERIGFEALNAEPCTALHSLVQAQKTKHLSEFKFSLDLIDLF